MSRRQPASQHAGVGTDVHLLDGTGHMAMTEAASEVNALLRAHIGR